MKIRGPLFFSIFTLIILVAAYSPFPKDTEKETVIMQSIVTVLEQLHFRPQKIDKDFSERVFNLYLERIDGGRRYLTQEEVNQLTAFQTDIDKEIQQGTYNFFDLSVKLVNQGIDRAQSFYKTILETPFDFSLEESVELDGDKRQFAQNEEQLKEYWRQYLKYEVLTRVHDKLEEQEDTGEEIEKKSLEDIEIEVREDVLEVMDGWFNRLKKLKRSDRLSIYLNAITNIYDPHTGYLEPVEKENFNIRFSGRFEGIGARLQSDGELTKVAEIIVGGPAWKDKELEEKDVILSVTQPGEDPVIIKGMQINDVVQMIRGAKDTKVILTVEKVDGTVKDIIITRGLVVIEEGFAKSLILDGTVEGEKIGYIYLPRFYADFEDRNGRFCSEDVAIETEKLKKAGVDGIILDLRNNGGGSLRDVVKMSGLFIEDGPIVQVKSRGSKPEVLKDVDSKVQYNGPFIVMVNSFSASASEILAAAMQDYGRAIIVGSQSTFGKGTVQRFFNLDRSIRGYNDIKPLGEIKFTMQKFYRINGGSTQLRGVTPDIILPDNFFYIETGEKEHEYPMEWTKIDPVDYRQDVYKIRNIDKIQERSELRVQDNPTFKKINENALRLQAQQDFSAVPLNLEGYKQLMEERDEEAAKYKDLFKNPVNDGVTNLEVDLPSIHADESKKARNEDWIKSVSKDIYIKETLNIMHDMIEFN